MTTATPGAVEKSYLVLDTLPANGGVIRLAEVARRAGLPKSTAHRILNLLTSLRLADKQDNGYRLGTRIIDLADQASRHRPWELRDRLLPHLLDLFASTGHAVHLGVPHPRGVLCLERLHGHQTVLLPFRIGQVLPAHYTALGRVLLAFDGDAPASDDAGLLIELDRVRRTGISVDQGGFRPLVTCVAAPVRGPNGRVAAAIMVAGPAQRLRIPKVTAALRQIADTASRGLALVREAG